MLCHPQWSQSWLSSRCQSSGWSMTGRLACTMRRTLWRGYALPLYLPQSWWREFSLLTSWGVTLCARNYSWMPWTTTWCPSGSTAGRPWPAGENETDKHSDINSHNHTTELFETGQWVIKCLPLVKFEQITDTSIMHLLMYWSHRLFNVEHVGGRCRPCRQCGISGLVHEDFGAPVT